MGFCVMFTLVQEYLNGHPSSSQGLQSTWHVWQSIRAFLHPTETDFFSFYTACHLDRPAANSQLWPQCIVLSSSDFDMADVECLEFSDVLSLLIILNYKFCYSAKMYL